VAPRPVPFAANTPPPAPPLAPPPPPPAIKIGLAFARNSIPDPPPPEEDAPAEPAATLYETPA
jgi:hypothetical protein